MQGTQEEQDATRPEKKKKMQVAKQNIQNLVVKNLAANARDIRDLSLIPGW